MKPSRETGLTSKDIAKIAGVSQSTVSRVLTNDPRVRAETRERVLRVLAEKKYEPNLAARMMRTGHTGVVGVVIARMTNPFHSYLLHTLAAKLTSVGLQTIFWHAEQGADQAAVQAIRQRRVDAMIFTTAAADSIPLAAAVDQGIPVLLVHRAVERLACDQVTGDNWEGGRMVGQYLTRRSRIGLISGDLNASTIREREMGFRSALASAGVEIADRDCARVDVSHREGREAARRMLDRDDPPDAIFAVNDITAFGVVDAARSLGVRVPDQLWVVGYDDIEMASWEAFNLTTVNEPVQDMVDRGVALLRQRLADSSSEPEKVCLPCTLVPRHSTGWAEAGTD